MRGKIRVSKLDARTLKTLLSEELHAQLMEERERKNEVSETLMLHIESNLLGRITTILYRLRSLTGNMVNTPCEDEAEEQQRLAWLRDWREVDSLARKLHGKVETLHRAREAARLHRNLMDRRRRKRQREAARKGSTTPS